MVELLVVTICLAVTALGILTAIGFANTQSVLARQRLAALSAATSEMEKYRSKAYYGSIASTNLTTPLSTVGLPQPANIQTTVSATSDPRVFNISVVVSWTAMISTGNVTRTIRLDSAMRNSDAP